MTDRNDPVSDDELHAFVDGELPAERIAAVEAHLAAHDDDAQRVAAWRAQAHLLRARYGGTANEPIPGRMALAQLLRKGRSWRAMAIAASLLAFVAGGAAGWVARGAATQPQSVDVVFTADAMQAHRLYIAEVRHPIEVRANENHLLPWLSRRIGTTLRAPDLASFDLSLLGGRLLPGPTPASPAAMIMYENAGGERITLYAAKVTGPATSFRYQETNAVGSMHWTEGGYAYAVSGPAGKARLKAIAQSAYEQMENRGGAPVNRSSADQLISRRGS